MIRHLTLVLALAFTVPAAAETIAANQAASHVGQTLTVQGFATHVYTSRSNTTFIDIDGRYPNQSFVAVIFARDAATVGDVSSLEGKNVAITGTVQLYQGKPEIIVKSRGQIAP